MKKRVMLPIALLLVVPLLTLAVAAQREQQWKKVEKAVEKGLPRTAIKHLEPIIAQAMKDKAYPEAIKAISKKIALEGNIQGNKPEVRITLMKQAIKKSPAEMKPVMNAILANWYWHFFQQNRWRFMQRTQTTASSGDDIMAWSLPRIMSEIDKQFTKALSQASILKKIPVEEYDPLLEKGNVPDAYRPTMYDFLAHNALDFYSAGEQAGAKAQDAFALSADTPIFAPAATFMKWEVETTDRESPTLKAIQLYQELLRFHQNDEDKTAFADADLLRLRFGYNQAFAETKNDRYKSALKTFAERWSNHQISARAKAMRASVLQQENELVEARKLALEGMKAFPDSIGGRMCYNIIQQIEAKSLQITTERVWNNPWPNIEVHYRNLTKVYFRAVPLDFEKRIQQIEHRSEYLNRAERKALLREQPVLEWSADLPATEDYRTRTEEIPAPKKLQAGAYFVIASHKPDFSDNDNQVAFTDVWVSELALVVRTRHGDGELSGFVLDALSGEPIAGAKVRAWHHTNNRRAAALEPTVTDQNGMFEFHAANNQNYFILAEHKNQQLASAHNFYLYRYNRNPRPYERTVFFTDRSLYRPGQTVQFQGLCIAVNQQKDDYEVIPNRRVTVVFADRNNKEVERSNLQTNEYGSFRGSFTTPAGRVTGMMRIRIDGNPPGQTTFNVEEYKRPKFEVTLKKPKSGTKLNGIVSVPGKATAYTGAPIDGAKVRYRVVREVRYPIWWHWRCWWHPPQTSSQEIANGFTNTDVDGTFQIDFIAQPDPTVPKKSEPTFHFKVYADVTDNTGETRSGQTSVNVGYTALRATLNADDWQTNDEPVEITVSTTTLDGEGQPADAVLKVYRLKQPEKVHRKPLQNQRHYRPVAHGEDKEPEPDLSNPLSWELGPVVFSKGLTTDAMGKASVSVKLKTGAYRATLDTQDRFGKKVTAELPITVLNPTAKNLTLKIPHLLSAPEWALQPGDTLSALWGTGYEKGRAFVEIEHRDKIIKSYWTPANQTQIKIEQDVTEEMRGGFTLRVTMVRENRAYLESRRINVPWTNKELKVRWGRFVSKLEPGQKETWTAIITGPNAKRAVAEMVATLYDASLDAYKPHQWMQSFGVFRHDHSHMNLQFENRIQQFQNIHGNWDVSRKPTLWTYRSFPSSIAANLRGYQFFAGQQLEMSNAEERPGAPKAGKNGLPADQNRRANGAPGGEPGPDLTGVTARKNLDETAFFFPQITSSENGEVELKFTMPEALTKWKFMGFAYDKELRSGYLEDSAVTSLDLMVQPNPPRFVREGDVIEFTVKVTNQSDKVQSGVVRLTMAKAQNGESVDTALANTDTDKSFEIPAKQSRSFAWRLKIPTGMDFLTYKTVASTGKLTDGEEGYLPVLSRRIFVTESMPFWVRGPEKKEFKFTRLLKSGKSSTLEHKQLVVQAVSHPSWYAVMALPYLMEYPYECSEQIFNRLYANALARHIAKSDPKIRKVFDQWKGTKALDSPLEKNTDLRAVMLEETPWLRQAQKESQARRNVGILFDDNRLNFEIANVTRRLSEMQLPDGAWPWFPGGRANDYITLYITTGFGRLRHLGVDVDASAAIRATNRMDNWIDRIYRDIVRDKRKDKNNLSPTIALYLYGRTFFLKERPINQQHQEAFDYFLSQAREHWLKLANRQSQAHMALALHRTGDRKNAKVIMRSIKERSVSNREMGMFWRDLEKSWWWFRAPIETQAMMIEAFHEVMNDAEAVEDCKIWLLRQKQTQDWKTTKATADAVYALLLRGPSPLVSDLVIDVALAGQKIEPSKVEAGTGFFEERFIGGEVKPEMGKVTVTKVDDGLSYGALHWQYLEDIDKVSSYEGTPLTLKKAFYTKEYTKKGPVLNPVKGPMKVGDELVVRVELRVDRDMEYVHLKDQRGSGTEPVNVLSRYRYQDGLAYYESTRDTATHFFIDYLPKGTYVFEYSTHVVHRGQYESGMAQIQCMYAPEFNSHSESFTLRVE